MNPWQTLNIQPTDDKKIIKKAYAILIKQYKPDENPEKFKQIQLAYKSALTLLKIQKNETSYLTDVNVNNRDREDNTSHKNPDFAIGDAPQIDKNFIAEQDKQEQLIENIYQQLHKMAFTPLVEKAKLKNWEFIEDYFKINDLTIKTSVARTVFKKVAEYNIFQAKQNKTLLISARILNYFNQIFDWRSQGLEYQEIFPDHYFRVTFDLFDNDTQFKGLLESRTGIFRRLWAFCIDYLVISVVTLIIIQVPLTDLTKSIVIALLFIFIRLSFELFSQTKSSLGKRYNSMIILDEYGNNCSQKLVLLRHLYASLSLVPLVYIVSIEAGYLYTWYYIIILIILSLNVFSWIFNKGLFHDMLTKTMVVDTV